MKETILGTDNYSKYSDERLQLLKEEYMNLSMSDKQLETLHWNMEKAKKDNAKMRKQRHIKKALTSAAAVIIAFIVLPNTSPKIAHAMEQIPVLGRLVDVITIQTYDHESERNTAHVEIPEISADSALGFSSDADTFSQTVNNVNLEVERIAENVLAEFKANLDAENGYQDLIVKSEVLTATDNYFTLKLFCYQGAGSGYQWNYYYTIDLSTGKLLRISDIFREGVDYTTPISNNIKEQMQTQMANDPNKYYWLNDEITEWNFVSITEDTSFYLNEYENLVICFNEGEVAPMYMGAVAFEIPNDVIGDLRK